jgi:hypothetical protein
MTWYVCMYVCMCIRVYEFKKRIDEFNAAVKRLDACGGANMDDMVCMYVCMYVYTCI